MERKAIETVQRHQLADYLKVGGVYELMGAGFNTLDENPTAQVDTKTYVNDKASSSVVKGYQTQFAYSSDLVKSEEVIMALYNVGRNQLTGADAQFDYLRVELFSPIRGKDNLYKARNFRVTCEVASFAAAGGETVVVSGNLYSNGDIVDGVFNTKTKEFLSLEAFEKTEKEEQKETVKAE